MDNGLWTVKFSDEPISGKIYSGFGEDGNLKKVYVGNIVNGKKEGKWVSFYHSTGKKMFEYNFKNGKVDGLNTQWYENGQKELERTFKDGKRDGTCREYYEDGQKMYEGTYKNGNKDGLNTQWYENGQKMLERTFKDGKEHGLTILWDDGNKYEKNFRDGKQHGLTIVWNKYGNKIMEGTFKDGYVISFKNWNNDGSLKKLEPFQNEDGSVKE